MSAAESLPVLSAQGKDVGRRPAGEVLLAVRDLTVEFRTRAGPVRAVEGVSLEVRRGETLCLVGESGCGKSVTSLAILGLVPDPPGRLVGGSVVFDGRDLLRLDPEERRKVRGGRIGMVFQEPAAALDPLFPVGEQIAEPLRVHRGMGRRAALKRAEELLGAMGIPSPGRRIHDYPHQLSGGMKQRVVIAAALACDPELLVADEPTTALDVTVQAQILTLLEEERRRRQLAMLFITHDLGVVAHIADRVAVLYAGSVVEEAPVERLFRAPAHPYTAGLLRSVPGPPAAALSADGRRYAIPGSVPEPGALPEGCRFAPRCDLAEERCREAFPELRPVAGGGLVRCVRA